MSEMSDWKHNLFANVMINTGCNRACPDCCVGDVVLRAKARTFAPDKIAAEVKELGDVGVVLLTGGEPTIHPKFDEVAAKCHEARGGLPLHMVTNGARLVHHEKSIRYFDAVRLSQFTEESNAGEPSDPAIAGNFRAVSTVKLLTGTTVHTRTSGKNACGRETHTISVMDGRVYGCCVACGIDGAESTELSPGWEERVRKVPLPCDRCVFGVV